MNPEPGLSTQLGEPKPSHSAIGRHLTALRDVARTILELFAPQADRDEEIDVAVATLLPGAGRTPIRTPKSPLEIRIECHSALIDQTLKVTAKLNPEGVSPKELPEDVRAALASQDRVIRGILDAEVHFWGATIENNPLTHLDETEESWVRRGIGLVARVGCSPDNEEHLAFLRKWSKSASLISARRDPRPRRSRSEILL
jgi:hypothetical protein